MNNYFYTKNIHKMNKSWVITCLINFFVATVLGLILRFSFIGNIAVNFRYLTHAHSHVAMLGWLYLMLYTFTVHLFVKRNQKVYRYLFFITQISILGMLFSFPFQGYAAFSIVFSSIHIFVSYFFVKLILKDLRPVNSAAKKFIRTALWFMVFSTFGIWLIPVSIVAFGKNSDAYNAAIQVFLHFQFDGWFLLGIFGLGIHYVLKNPLQKDSVLKKALSWLTVSIIFTLFLPVGWYIKHPFFSYLNSVGVILQLVGFYYLFAALKTPVKTFYSEASLFVKIMGMFILASLLVKVLFQTFSVFPVVIEAAIQTRNFVVGFVHLLMLGVISGALLMFLSIEGFFVRRKGVIYLAAALYISGFILSELLLFLQGLMSYFLWGAVPAFNLNMFIFSAFIVAGVFLFLLNIFGAFPGLFSEKIETNRHNK